jgi:hypothetical protein
VTVVLEERPLAGRYNDKIKGHDIEVDLWQVASDFFNLPSKRQSQRVGYALFVSATPTGSMTTYQRSTDRLLMYSFMVEILPIQVSWTRLKASGDG